MPVTVKGSCAIAREAMKTKPIAERTNEMWVDRRNMRHLQSSMRVLVIGGNAVARPWPSHETKGVKPHLTFDGGTGFVGVNSGHAARRSSGLEVAVLGVWGA